MRWGRGWTAAVQEPWGARGMRGAVCAGLKPKANPSMEWPSPPRLPRSQAGRPREAHAGGQGGHRARAVRQGGATRAHSRRYHAAAVRRGEEGSGTAKYLGLVWGSSGIIPPHLTPPPLPRSRLVHTAQQPPACRGDVGAPLCLFSAGPLPFCPPATNWLAYRAAQGVEEQLWGRARVLLLKPTQPLAAGQRGRPGSPALPSARPALLPPSFSAQLTTAGASGARASARASSHCSHPKRSLPLARAAIMARSVMLQAMLLLAAAAAGEKHALWVLTEEVARPP